MQKVLFSLLLTFGCLGLNAQAPEGFGYNAVVRNTSGDPVADQAVSFFFSIIRGSAAGPVIYSEKHNITTDNFGFVSLVIGNGTDTIGTFAAIAWGADKYFLKVELDNTGGTAYSDMGTTQFFSVPYSLYSKTAGNGFSGDYRDLTHKPLTNGSETRVIASNNITVSGAGTSANPYVIGNSPPIIPMTHFIGENFGGGIVFYVYDEMRHGLIASTRDQNNLISWYNGIKRNTNTTGDGLNAGSMNTTLIIALQTNDNPMGNFAAKVCADFSITVDGVTYGDWYLPSKYELGLLFSQKDLIGGFNNDVYWSSTEFSSITSWSQNFSNGKQVNLSKSLPYSVRAIRAF